MGKFKHRSYQKELMDELASGGEEIVQTLRELKTINKWLGGNYVTTNGLKKLIKNKTTQPHIADIGCGGGDMLQLMAAWCARQKINASFTGVDANNNIINYAKEHTSAYPQINYLCADVFSDDFLNQKFEIITATLFCHHFTDDELVQLFQSMQKQASLGIVINDLHRHWFAFYAIKVLTKLFSKSKMVINDAPLSVLRSFTRKDIERIMKAAGIQHYSLRWNWAFRWQIIIYTGLA
ncbi:MAG TPA: methyltransferase domain-containing protein [Cyclobacteriaceae bacterium]|nr:methyltransferase domain-containing protein [Cyclobacteriaceae bacterium]